MRDCQREDGVSSGRVRDVQGAQQSGLPDRAEAEPGAARPEGQRPAILPPLEKRVRSVTCRVALRRFMN